MSPKRAIANMCRHCIYDPQGSFGNWRQQVTLCTSFGCPLYALRPKSRAPLPRSLLDKAGLSERDFPDRDFDIKDER